MSLRLGLSASSLFVASTLAVLARAGDVSLASACELQANPAAFHKARVTVTAFISHGLEDFTLFDPSCRSRPYVWLEYGGAASSGTVYCCGASTSRRRHQPLRLEGITVPLQEDDLFREFDRLIQRQPDSLVRATITGRFFSGRSDAPGYGHMGCCSLLVIERVNSVEPPPRRYLDVRAWPDTPAIRREGCGYRMLLPVDSVPHQLLVQQQADHGHLDWVFADPRRVAQADLARLLSVDAKAVTGLRLKTSTQGRALFEWRPARQGKSYFVVVSRPYWLSFYSRDPSRVAWVLIAAYEVECD